MGLEASHTRLHRAASGPLGRGVRPDASRRSESHHVVRSSSHSLATSAMMRPDIERSSSPGSGRRARP